MLCSFTNTNSLLTIYCTCIRPHLEYACQFWDTFTNKHYVKSYVYEKCGKIVGIMVQIMLLSNCGKMLSKAFEYCAKM